MIFRNLRYHETHWTGGRVFANGPGDLGSIPGFVIPKTLKMVLDTYCLTLSKWRYVSRIKWSNPWKGVAPSPTPQWCSYWKGSLLVALDYGRQLYLPGFTCTLDLFWSYSGVQSRYRFLYGFSLVWFYGLSTFVGYLMPNLVSTNIFDI